MKNWFESSLGQWLLAEEKALCQRLIPSGYYPSSLQLGIAGQDFLDSVEIGARFQVVDSAHIEGSVEGGHVDHEHVVHRVEAKSHALPFGEKTHSLIVLPHVLEFCDDPHAVLREVNQILIPEGCLVITGFNRLSLWGAARRGKGYTNSPWSGHSYRVKRVQDWLSLLGFDVVGAKMMAYGPPLQSEKWRDKSAFIELMGDRWWPGLGASYVIVAKKRQVASSGGSVRSAWRRFVPAMAQPAVSAAQGFRQGSGKAKLRLVVDN